MIVGIIKHNVEGQFHILLLFYLAYTSSRDILPTMFPELLFAVSPMD